MTDALDPKEKQKKLLTEGENEEDGDRADLRTVRGAPSRAATDAKNFSSGRSRKDDNDTASRAEDDSEAEVSDSPAVDPSKSVGDVLPVPREARPARRSVGLPKGVAATYRKLLLLEIEMDDMLGIVAENPSAEKKKERRAERLSEKLKALHAHFEQLKAAGKPKHLQRELKKVETEFVDKNLCDDALIQSLILSVGTESIAKLAGPTKASKAAASAAACKIKPGPVAHSPQVRKDAAASPPVRGKALSNKRPAQSSSADKAHEAAPPQKKPRSRIVRGLEDDGDQDGDSTDDEVTNPASSLAPISTSLALPPVSASSPLSGPLLGPLLGPLSGSFPSLLALPRPPAVKELAAVSSPSARSLAPIVSEPLLRRAGISPPRALVAPVTAPAAEANLSDKARFRVELAQFQAQSDGRYTQLLASFTQLVAKFEEQAKKLLDLEARLLAQGEEKKRGEFGNVVEISAALSLLPQSCYTVDPCWSISPVGSVVAGVASLASSSSSSASFPPDSNDPSDCAVVPVDSRFSCVSCTKKFITGVAITTLRCGHFFHTGCLERFCFVIPSCCPVCQVPII